MFAGHNAYRFATDPFYANGFIPTVRATGRAHSHGTVARPGLRPGPRQGQVPGRY